jgi:signal transduction histidine kinase
MNIFRQLRWKLTLSYTLVTVSAFLVVTLILGAIVYSRIFIPVNVLSPAGLVEIVRQNSTPLWSQVLSKNPIDTDLINILLQVGNSQITSQDFLHIGMVQFAIKTVASYRALIISADGTLLGRSEPSYLPTIKIGQPFDITRVPGLEIPFTAALAGETDPNLLHTVRGPTIIPTEMIDRFTIAIPVFRNTSETQDQVIAVLVFIIDGFPTQRSIPANLLNMAGKSLLIFVLGTGLMGAVFGFFTANGLVKRFRRISTATDAWSEGDFSRFIVDRVGDEISRFVQRLNNMAKQLHSLLLKRQETAISEERNRLARDLHDSAKQLALAASFELGTALSLYDSDPEEAKKHLVEADGLVDSVKKELTNLVLELRPWAIEGQDFSEVLNEYAKEWSNRTGITLKMDIQGETEYSGEYAGEDSLSTREALFRIAQEALANVARHSSASSVELCLEYQQDHLALTVKDNGCGFDPQLPHSGLGLYSMRERAEGLSGSFTIESEIGKGTKIVVSLPKAS